MQQSSRTTWIVRSADAECGHPTCALWFVLHCRVAQFRHAPFPFQPTGLRPLVLPVMPAKLVRRNSSKISGYPSKHATHKPRVHGAPAFTHAAPKSRYSSICANDDRKAYATASCLHLSSVSTTSSYASYRGLRFQGTCQHDSHCHR